MAVYDVLPKAECQAFALLRKSRKPPR